MTFDKKLDVVLACLSVTLIVTGGLLDHFVGDVAKYDMVATAALFLMATQVGMIIAFVRQERRRLRKVEELRP